MDSKAILDYALFQLTPTRTRCDLVVFCGKKSEKLASGLMEPFKSHLKYAQDQIPKGGYSITLRPPATVDDASWFTKATFQRFVRFVSTPEILERIIRIEREILQIETSTQSNEIPKEEVTRHTGEAADGITKKSSNSKKLNSDEEIDGAALEENSRIRLQRLMDTRKALLLKEQAMAYARAVVAGYEMDSINDLICFADTFGALRLREACTDFKELYKKKHSDDQWMDELAAVQASDMASTLSYMGTSGILLAGENIPGNFPLVRSVSSEPISDTTASPANSDGTKENNSTTPEQTPNGQQMPWMNQIPQYMYNLQAYQGYPFPGMHAVQPYYPGHMGWQPPGGNNMPSKNQKKHKSSSRKKERSLDDENEKSASEQSESSDSYSETDSDEEDKKHSSKGQSQIHGKRNKKKTSKTVVIRNINYITSQRHNEEETEVSDNNSSDESYIREGVDNALATLEKRNNHSKAHKNREKPGSIAQNENNSVEEKTTWDAFQNILMSRDDSVPDDLLDEHYMMKNSNDGLSDKIKNTLFLDSENVKAKSLTTDDSVLMFQKNGQNGVKAHMVDFTNGEETYTRKKFASEDENALFSQHYQESRTGLQGNLPDYSTESATIKNRKGEDWFVVNPSLSSEAQEAKKLDTLSYERDIVHKQTSTRTAVVDDSFIIESRSVSNEPYVSNWRTDISMSADIDIANELQNRSVAKSGSGISEPNDLYMMVMRESQDSARASWTPEMEYEVKISPIVKGNDHTEEPIVNGKKEGGKKVTKSIGKDVKSKALSGSFSKSRLDYLSNSKKIPSSNKSMVHKSKFEKEEEERKRLEEIVIQRQKRIAERTAARGSTPTASKKNPVGNKAAPAKLEKKRS
ncbi:hypothetical protein ACJIZ3_013179 [Penstemon smallii]|uniref:COP1-interacting protein 7 n=1 Tax=Penstemon smallii TaxID=265156 RepID=A0ABD3UP45_9LAMI